MANAARGVLKNQKGVFLLPYTDNIPCDAEPIENSEKFLKSGATYKAIANHNTAPTPHAGKFEPAGAVSTHNTAPTPHAGKFEPAGVVSTHNNDLNAHNGRIKNAENLLGAHGETLAGHQTTLVNNTETLFGHEATLVGHRETLSAHTTTLGEHTTTLDEHSTHIQGIVDNLRNKGVYDNTLEIVGDGKDFNNLNLAQGNYFFHVADPNTVMNPPFSPLRSGWFIYHKLNSGSYLMIFIPHDNNIVYFRVFYPGAILTAWSKLIDYSPHGLACCIGCQDIDPDTLTVQGNYFLSNWNNIIHNPFGAGAFFLEVKNSGDNSFIEQIGRNYAEGGTVARRVKIEGVWRPWASIGSFTPNYAAGVDVTSAYSYGWTASADGWIFVKLGAGAWCYINGNVVAIGLTSSTEQGITFMVPIKSGDILKRGSGNGSGWTSPDKAISMLVFYPNR